MTAFFVPGVEDDRAEARYAELAALAEADVAPLSERILSVRFARGAEEWTATVGETLSGQLAARTDRRPARRSASPRSAPTRSVSDPATVHAIFEVGDSYRVVTDARPVGRIDDSTWANPLAVPRHDARRVARFGT